MQTLRRSLRSSKVILLVAALLTGAVALYLGVGYRVFANTTVHQHLIARLTLPNDLKIERFADVSPLGKPRMLAVLPSGELLVTLVDTGLVVKLDGQGTPSIIASGLNNPNGLVVRDEDILVAEIDGVVKLPKLAQGWGAKVPFIRNLPIGGHALKTIKQSPTGDLLINVGSSCNVCIENDPTRATILRFDHNGRPAGALRTLGRHTQSAIWAKGLRNSQSFAWHPITGAMFATNEGADNRSDQKNGAINDALPPEHLNQIEGGQHYGWPYCWADPEHAGQMMQDPNFLGDDQFCATTQAPAITFESHSTPIGISFLDKSKLPVQYLGDAVVALHGSWNRKQPSGYRVVRVQFRNHQPVAVVPLIDGWLTQQQAWGRPVDVIVGHDGMLYISDDLNGWIYKVSPNSR